MDFRPADWHSLPVETNDEILKSFCYLVSYSAYWSWLYNLGVCFMVSALVLARSALTFRKSFSYWDTLS
jgi:hypothetical protein